MDDGAEYEMSPVSTLSRIGHGSMAAKPSRPTETVIENQRWKH